MAGNFFYSQKSRIFAPKVIRMKKAIYLLLLLTTLCACSNKGKGIRISGKIEGIKTDTIYLYAGDGLYEHIDTIAIKDGKFDTKLKKDSLSVGRLLFSDGMEIPVFLNKDDHIKIKGNINDLSSLVVSGNEDNDNYETFKKEIKNLPTPAAVQQKAIEFINKYPSSIVSSYLIERNFMSEEYPDFNKIQSLIKKLDKKIQARPEVNRLSEYIRQWQVVNKGKAAPPFSLPTERGTLVSLNKFKGNYVLLNFWVSWSDKCKKSLSTLRRHKELLQDKKVKVIGVSLDVDKLTWRNAIRMDSIQGVQVCDFTGMNSIIAQRYAVLRMPTNILIAPNGTILARDFPLDRISDYLH